MGESYAALGSSQEWLAFQASTAQGNSGKLISFLFQVVFKVILL